MKSIKSIFISMFFLISSVVFCHEIFAYDDCSYYDHTIPCFLPYSRIILDSVMGNDAGMVGYFVGACYKATESYVNGQDYVALVAIEDPIPEGIPEGCAYYHSSKSFLWINSDYVFGGFGQAGFLKDPGFFWSNKTIGNNSGAAFSIRPDTGQTKCFNDTEEIPCLSPGEPFYGQDAQHNGPARSYTLLGGGTMVQDNVTGLIWEMKNSKDGTENYNNPNDADNTYTWCDPNRDTNGGTTGTCGVNDTVDFIDQLNSGSGFGGYTDWRMPTIQELVTLTAFGQIFPAIDPIFAATTQSSEYWSSTTKMYLPDFVSIVNFNDLYDYDSHKSNSHYVRAVRGGQNPSENRFVDNGDTVTDTVTCLQWQKATMDTKNGPGPDIYTWQEALAASEGLSLAGHADWRLPDKNELYSLFDPSRYSPSMDPVFKGTTELDFFYWSSTTDTGYPNSARIVGFYDRTLNYDRKSYSNYVRAVRGQQCGNFGVLRSLEVTAPQSINVGEQFQLNLRMIDGFGQAVSSSFDRVYLSSSCGPVDPVAVDLVAGVATYPVRLFSPSAGCEIYARAGNVAGKVQNFIEVLSDWLTGGSFNGKVVDKLGQGLADATVHLQLVTPPFTSKTMVTGTDGSFIFTDLYPGQYLTWAVVDGTVSLFSTKSTVNLNLGANPGLTLKVRSKQPPVLLVPGFEGSDRKVEEGFWGHIAPSMPLENLPDQENLVIHNFNDVVGWNNLINELKDMGFEVFDCPWDWRQSPGDKEVWEKYLKKTIDDAKAATGYDKVDIVAHSMGGIMVRAYIVDQSYRNDINRFAMGGSPNHGTYLAYPVWEGGDPILCDNMKGDVGKWQSWGDYFHSQAISQEYYNKMGVNLIQFENWAGNNIIPQMQKSKKEVRKFVRNNIPLLQTVMPYDDCFLETSPDLQGSWGCSGVVGDGSRNNLLPELNSQTKIDLMINRVDKVKIFGTDKQDTVYQINIGPSSDEVYEQGTPKPTKDDWSFTNGDNLTTKDGLLLSGVDFQVDKNCESMEDCTHANLISFYRDEIIQFLTEGRAVTVAQKSKALANSDSPNPALFRLAVNGSVTFLVSGPDGKQNGINANGEVLNENVDVEIYRNFDGMSVRYTNPLTGSYHISFASAFVNKAEASFGYIADSEGEELKVPLYIDGNQDSFTIDLNPLSDPALTVQMSIAPPHNLQTAEVNGNTALSWEAPSGAAVASYKIYSRDETEAFFNLLHTVSGTALASQTNHPFGIPRRLYTMSSVDAQGKESILSETIDNELRVITTYGYSMADAIRILQILADMTLTTPVATVSDINDDQRLGLAEVIEVLKELAQ